MRVRKGWGYIRISELRKFCYRERMAKSPAILTLRRNGQITLPADVRRRARASEGDVFLAEVRDDDEIVLRKKSLVDASQAYFWTEEWQRGEREAQEDIRRGRTKRFRSAKALIADLKR
jgi:AbrB family looped-hinge helix DNA binding protein